VRVKMGWLGFGGSRRMTRRREMVGSGGGKFPSLGYAALSGIRIALSRMMHEVEMLQHTPFFLISHSISPHRPTSPEEPDHTSSSH